MVSDDMTDKQGAAMAEGIKENLGNTNHWLRLLLTVIYALIFVLGTWVLGFVVLLTLLILLFTGERNSNLVQFGGQLSAYLAQIMDYATLNSDTKPFPFGEWSAADPVEPTAAPEAPAAPAPAKAKAKAKKKTTTRKAAKKTASKDQP